MAARGKALSEKGKRSRWLRPVLFALFRQKPIKTAAIQQEVGTGPALPEQLLLPESASRLLATPRRQHLLEHIWQRTSLSHQQFAALYQGPLERYAELAQQLPASETHHHAYPGGMLDHGLEIVAYALKLRQSHLLPTGVTPEAQVAQAEAWSAAVAYAALLHDIGKIAVDLHVEYQDGQIWHPWHGPLRRPYRFRYRPSREYRLHGAATGLLYTQVLDHQILDWLSGFPELWAALLYVLAGQYEHAGVLGELVSQADQASVAQALGGDPAKAMAAPRHALQRKLLEGLRYLLRETLKINQPQASDGWLTQDGLWLVSKTVSDKLRAHLLSQGVDGIPSSNTAVFDVLQEHGIAQPTPDGKAIWKATVASPGGWTNSFTFLRLSPALIWDAAERPEPFAGSIVVGEPNALPDLGSTLAYDGSVPQQPDAGSAAGPTDEVGDLLAMLGVEEAGPEPTPAVGSPVDATPSGEHFISWLRHAIQSRRLIINDARALVHTVADTAYLVTPGVFQRYAQEHPQSAYLAKREGLPDWEWAQRRFEKLRLHRKQPDGLNIWHCAVIGSRRTRTLHGYLLADAKVLFDEVPPNNPYLRLAE
jgi:integrating conjugative element relaxase (TIGR03760 family)